MIDEIYSHFLSEYRLQEMAKMQIDLPTVAGGNGQRNPAVPVA